MFKCFFKHDWEITFQDEGRITRVYVNKYTNKERAEIREGIITLYKCKRCNKEKAALNIGGEKEKLNVDVVNYHIENDEK